MAWRGVRALSQLVRPVRIYEVGPRDGLQNEAPVSTDIKVELISRLAASGLTTIETTSFVSPKWVPQMSDAKEVYRYGFQLRDLHLPVIVPNRRGFDLAESVAMGVGHQVDEVAVLAACSPGFTKKNLNMTLDENLDRLSQLVDYMRARNVRVRGYLSTAIACPYDGWTAPETCRTIAKLLLDMGCYEISLGDTIGVGTPRQIEAMIDAVSQSVPIDRLAIHAHDTYGQGVANVVRAVEMGVRTVDSSVGGLGGCPYAKGASGNVATEDVIYSLHGMGFETGISLSKLVETSRWICDKLGKPLSKVAAALSAP